MDHSKYINNLTEDDTEELFIAVCNQINSGRIAQLLWRNFHPAHVQDIINALQDDVQDYAGE